MVSTGLGPRRRRDSGDPAPEGPSHERESAIQSARKVGLRYVNDAQPGIRRSRIGEKFRYLDPGGRVLRDKETLARIKSLVVPPAWNDVWICAAANGHIQVTARDAKGRKQYRYHPLWRKVRDENKYEHLIAFGKSLPTIRKRVEKDLSLPGLPREKILATIVRLLETTMMRVGNEEYVRSNGSFGLTTLRDKHVRIDGARLEFAFRGKSGVKHSINLTDRRLAAIVRRSRDLPGYELFQYLDADGERRSVDSEDVNEYLRGISGQGYTAKDFRTWAGTLLAALALREFEKFDSQAQAKKNLVRAIESVAAKLGNTPAICRKCYVHPAVMESYLDGSMLEAVQRRAEEGLAEDMHDLNPEEAAVLALLQQRLQRPPVKPGKPRGSRKDAGRRTAHRAGAGAEKPQPRM
ncbi:MAG TPA: DNA topoisomerase IB [Burkholderiales bacterium]|nr:DNA topoisomerase IB [Burkholderiales bacterium]